MSPSLSLSLCFHSCLQSLFLLALPFFFVVVVVFCYFVSFWSLDYFLLYSRFFFSFFCGFQLLLNKACFLFPRYPATCLICIWVHPLVFLFYLVTDRANLHVSLCLSTPLPIYDLGGWYHLLNHDIGLLCHSQWSDWCSPVPVIRPRDSPGAGNQVSQVDCRHQAVTGSADTNPFATIKACNTTKQVMQIKKQQATIERLKNSHFISVMQLHMFFCVVLAEYSYFFLFVSINIMFMAPNWNSKVEFYYLLYKGITK